jgi:hypothetical protein
MSGRLKQFLYGIRFGSGLRLVAVDTVHEPDKRIEQILPARMR